MSDLHERFRSLGREVVGLPALPVEDVRRRVARQRRARLGAAGAAATTVVAVAAAALGAGGGGEPSRLVAGPTSAPPVASSQASAGPSEVQPWLAAPWVLEDSTSAVWPPGEPGSYAFCGRRPYVPPEPMRVGEQLLRHPDGRRARLLKVTSDAGASQVWKWSYAECRVPGRAESVGGLRNVWSYGIVAAASQLVGPSPITAEAATRSTMHLLELTGSPKSPASRDHVDELMDAWAGPGGDRRATAARYIRRADVDLRLILDAATSVDPCHS